MKTSIAIILVFFFFSQTYCQVESEISDLADAPNIIILQGNNAAKFAMLSENSDNTNNDNETLGSSWNAYGKGYTTPGYYIDNDRVFFRGLLRKEGAMNPGEVIFILAEDYRPTGRKLCSGGQEGQNIRIDILANGEVKYMSGSNPERNFISLEGISFDIN